MTELEHPRKKIENMRLLTLYIGTNQAGAKSEIICIVSARYPSFTLIQGEGYFRGSAEMVWIVKIATEDCSRVIETAAEIRQALHQEGVGIEFGGKYYRCTAADCASALSKAWEDAKQSSV